MKLTKRLLAIVLAAAMLVGMVVISTSAVQLDEDVPTLTWDDCVDINAETNPYTVKMGFKIYKVDTDSGEYTLLADTNSANDTLDVNVEPGDVLRVETWAQTNFHTIGIQLTPAYNNAWLLPTTMDYTVVASTASHPLKVASAGAKTPMSDFGKILDFCDEYGTGDGTFENPVFVNEALTQAKGQINHNSWGGLRGVLPKDWQGTGQTEAKWLNTDAKDQWGNSIVDENGHLIYNVYQFGMGNNATGTEAWVGYGVVLNVYQPIAAFNLTVADDAAGTSKLFFPESSYKNTTNAYTQFTAMSYEAVQDSPNVNGNWDESMPQVCSSGLTTYANKVTYGDGTVADKNWIVTNATITVGGGSTPEEPSTDETTTEAAKADLTALKAAIAAAATADTANCTSASVAEFNAALAAAQALNVEGTLATEQAAIDAAAARLNKAISDLTKLGVCDYSALNAAIAAYEAKVADKALYTNWADYEAAYNAAKAIAKDLIADEPGANQAKIDAAAADLNAVVLTYKAADYSAVEAAKSLAAALDSNAYTAASLKAVTDAVNAVVYGLDITKQAQVDAMAKAINDAIGKIVPLGNCDYAAVDAALVAAQAYVTNKANYTPASWAASDIDNAYSAAFAIATGDKLIADEAGVNQAKIDAAAKALTDACAKLVLKADKAALAAAIAAAPVDSSAYTPDSWAAADLGNVLAAANAVNADDNATQADVDAQVAAIAAAEAKLVLKADKSILAAVIAAARDLDPADWTPASWVAADLAAAIAAAEAVYADPNATDAAVADAIAALETAATKLVAKADFAALNAAIATLPTVSEEDAVPETWAAYEAALAEAKAVAADANATQDAVNAAEAKLLAAIAGVQEKETVYCDYTALDAALAACEAKKADKDLYANWADYEALVFEETAKVPAVGSEYTPERQAAIDAAAAAINAFVLEYKAADYSAVDAAKALAAALDPNAYTEASLKAVADAVAAVVEGYDITKQAEVDAMAKAINDAISVLVPLGNCDYTALDAAIAAYEAKLADKDLYANWAAYEAAYNAAKAVARDMIADEDGVNQTTINDAVEALTAIELEYKAADYSAVEAAIAAAQFDASKYTAASVKAVNDAIAAVVYGLDITKQAEVDAYAAAIRDAYAELAPLAAADYTALDAALALVPAEAEDAYTAASWKAYADAKAAAEAIARDLLADEAGKNQKAIDDAAAALVKAYEGLKINKANVTNVEFDATGIYDKTVLDYAVTVNGAPSKIQIVTADGGTITFDRRHANVTIKSYNAAGEEINYADEDPAYEIWTISNKLALAAGDYTIKAKYDYTWDTEAYAFTVEYDEYKAEAEAFTATVGDYVDATVVTAAKGETITFKAVTPSTTVKIQFVFADGGTSTYSKDKAVDNGDGTLTWTVTRTFTKAQNINLKVKTPAGWATEYTGNVQVAIG